MGINSVFLNFLHCGTSVVKDLIDFHPTLFLH
jgi:hypothetical protein